MNRRIKESQLLWLVFAIEISTFAYLKIFNSSYTATIWSLFFISFVNFVAVGIVLFNFVKNIRAKGWGENLTTFIGLLLVVGFWVFTLQHDYNFKAEVELTILNRASRPITSITVTANETDVLRIENVKADETLKRLVQNIQSGPIYLEVRYQDGKIAKESVLWVVNHSLNRQPRVEV